MQLTRTPSGPHSAARLRPSAKSAALVTPYMPITVEAFKAPIEMMKMIEPSCRSRISGATIFDSHRLLKTLLVIIRSNAWSLRSANEP